ncbi:uncharacterized protein LOC131946164 [Physella acuta]|uniref:uncharacterized protein LOC131946164 n=1 Tax=Physella acuta TaxID=109671 RepID=UPI0027DE01D2|nr:uncharacterized protein LOC131946164 [Physella acuta]
MYFTCVLCTFVLLLFQRPLCAETNNDEDKRISSDIQTPNLKSLELFLDRSKVRPPPPFVCVRNENWANEDQWTTHLMRKKLALCDVKPDGEKGIVVLVRALTMLNFIYMCKFI